jgi:pSer/pThr/pTyr-binding forkhead associated (FHA) protein
VRRSVAQVISNWSKAKVVTKRQNRFVLLKPDRLEELARSIRGSLVYQMGKPLTIKAPSQEVSQAVLEVVGGPGEDQGRKITFEREILIGRQPPCALVLSDTNVSRIHCRVFKGATGGRFWIEDLDSTNGTLVNEKKIRRAVLHDGHKLQLGACKIDFHVKQPGGSG